MGKTLGLNCSADLKYGEMIVYKNIAQDCGIDYRTVKDYFDVGMANYLLNTKALKVNHEGTQRIN